MTTEESRPEEPAARASIADRLRRALLPAAAATGASALGLYALLRGRPSPIAPRPPDAPKSEPLPPPPLPRVYSPAGELGGGGAFPSLLGIAIGPGDRPHVLAGGEVKVFDAAGRPAASWKAPAGAECISVAADGRVALGGGPRVDIFDAAGKPAGGFAIGEPDRPAAVTAVRIVGGDVLVADASGRRILRLDASGKRLGEIGTRNATGCFILPNRSLDFDVGPDGIVRATDSGRHRVTAWTIEGEPRGGFGKFGQRAAEDFAGCCNPVNLAVAPGGEIVTGEKAAARVKVYERDGTLLAYIGPEHFDASAVHIHLAVDSKGRIFAGDPVRRLVKVFARQETP